MLLSNQQHLLTLLLPLSRRQMFPTKEHALEALQLCHLVVSFSLQTVALPMPSHLDHTQAGTAVCVTVLNSQQASCWLSSCLSEHILAQICLGQVQPSHSGSSWLAECIWLHLI